MSPQLENEAIKTLKGLNDLGDKESAHIFADEILCKLLKALGYTKIVNAWEKVDKWCI